MMKGRQNKAESVVTAERLIQRPPPRFQFFTLVFYSSIGILYFFVLARQRISPLFPYTTLFRSQRYLDRYEVPHRRRVSRARRPRGHRRGAGGTRGDRKSTRLNSSHTVNSYAVFCLKKKRNCSIV